MGRGRGCGRLGGFVVVVIIVGFPLPDVRETLSRYSIRGAFVSKPKDGRRPFPPPTLALRVAGRPVPSDWKRSGTAAAGAAAGASGADDE